jgi:phosphatidylserine decarboxylase
MGNSNANQIRLVGNRRTGEIVVEEVLGGGLLALAYQSRLSPFLRAMLLRTGAISRLLGWFSDTKWSRRKIDGIVEQLSIDMEDFEVPDGGYRTFNQWFTRRLKPNVRPFDPDPEVLVSPADCRLTVIPELHETTVIPVKGAQFSVENLLKTTPDRVENFRGGAVMVFRLCPVDYHRYHFPADGQVLGSHEISGRYESVNPIAIAANIPVFTENRRVVTHLELGSFGPTAFVEVGAFGVGGIVDTHGGGTFEKMEEKGYFRYGASTLVLVFEPNRLKIDKDLIEHSAAGMEILVQAGETLGRLL